MSNFAILGAKQLSVAVASRPTLPLCQPICKSTFLSKHYNLPHLLMQCCVRLIVKLSGQAVAFRVLAGRVSFGISLRARNAVSHIIHTCIVNSVHR